MMILASFVKICYTFDVVQSTYQYYTGAILFFSATLIAEMASISIVSKTISPELNNTFWNAGLFGGTADTLGRGVGNAFFTIYSISQKRRQPETYYASAVNIFCSFVFMIVTWIFLRKLIKHVEVHLKKKKDEKKKYY